MTPRMPFSSTTDDGRLHYAIGGCLGRYVATKGTEAAWLGLYVAGNGSPPFAFFIHREDGHRLLFQAGPEYSKCVEAALIDGWVAFGTPPSAWHLVDIKATRNIVADDQKRQYLAARASFCRAIYGPRLKIWSAKELRTGLFFLPPDTGFDNSNPNEPTPENEEVLKAMLERS